MDQVSPALQYGLDQVETCSWKSSSPHACQSSNDSTLAGSLELSSNVTNPRETVAYSVITFEGNPPSRSRDSTSSPANLHILQESDGSVCKEEELQQQSSGEYSCGMADASAAEPSPQEVRSKKGYHGYPDASASASAFEDENYQHIVDMTVPPAASAEEGTGSDYRGIPQCMQFGTFLQPGKKDPRIMIALEGAELWDQFFQAGTEMIITKSGRSVAIIAS